MLSLVTPTYNRAKMLDRLWHSIFPQTEREYEWLVVDDGSTDETASFMIDLSKRDSRVSYLPMSTNAGVNHARNFGVLHAKEQILVFIDSDDHFFDSNVLSMITRHWAAAPPDIGVIMFRYVESSSGPVGTVKCAGSCLDYNQVVSGEAFSGDFLMTVRRACFSTCMFYEVSPAGGEYLTWWDIARTWQFLVVDEIAAWHNDDAADRLTSQRNLVRHAATLKLMNQQALINHPEVMDHAKTYKRIRRSIAYYDMLMNRRISAFRGYLGTADLSWEGAATAALACSCIVFGSWTRWPLAFRNWLKH